MSNTAVADELQSYLGRIRPGAALCRDGLTAVPLLAATADLDADADLLEEGLHDRRTTVTEVSEAGLVGRVLVRHQGPRPLLLLHGEEVIGAKQNRIFNASFVIHGGSAAEVPVSCVESGRWSYSTPEFAAAERTVTSSLRCSSLSRVSASVGRGRGYDAAQDDVWDEVACYLRRSDVYSPTTAYAAAANYRRDHTAALLDWLRPGADWAGVAVLAGRRLLSLDLFGSPSLLARAFKKVVAGVAAETGDHPAEGPADGADVERVLTSIAERPFLRQSAVGGCETLHAQGDPAVGAVVAGGRLYHLFAGSPATP